MSSNLPVPAEIRGERLHLTFERFDLAAYRTFLAAKEQPERDVTYCWRHDRYTVTMPARFAGRLGLEAPTPIRSRLPLADHLRDYQRWSTEMALGAKRFALWADTGLGKTICFLEWARQVVNSTGGRVLIVSPPMIIPQTIEAAGDFYGGALPIQPLATRQDLADFCRAGAGVAITNYEKFIPGIIPELKLLAGIIPDESSILRTGGGTIKWNLIKSARGIEYKLSCTATPAPNEVMEYASQAAFLEKIRSEGDVLWTYFQRDKRGTWGIKPHAMRAFYRFLASWSLYIRDPAAFGFRDILSSIPEPDMPDPETVPLTDEQRTAMQAVLVEHHIGLWADDRVSVTVRQKLLQIARGFQYQGRGKDRTVVRMPSHKMRRVAELAAAAVQGAGPVLIWTTFDEEAAILVEEIGRRSDARVGIIDGAMPIEARTATVARVRAGELDIVISKPQLLGYGLNLQFIQTMIFCGFDDSFERRYQALRRALRLGQTRQLHVRTVYCPELEGLVFENLAQKEARYLQDVAMQQDAYRAILGELGQLPGIEAP